MAKETQKEQERYRNSLGLTARYLYDTYGKNASEAYNGIRLNDLYGSDDEPPMNLQNVNPMAIAADRIGIASSEGVPQIQQYGQSRYDRQFITNSELEDLDRLRYERQGAFARLGVGTLKIVPRALTLVPETLGMAWAGAEALFTDKTFAETLQEQFENNPGFLIDDVVDNALTIYRPENYEDMNLLQRMGTSSFWSDDILANMGFQLGAGAIYKGVLKGVSKALSKATTKAVINGNRIARGIQMGFPALTAGYVSSVAESGVEARSFYNEMIMNKQTELNNELAKELEYIDNTYGTNPEFQQNIIQLKEAAYERYNKQLEDYKTIASNEARKLYNYNKGVLTISNILTFGTLFKTGFNGNLSDIATRATKEGLLKNAGMKHGIVAFGKNILTEGGEEGLQHIGKDIADYQAEQYSKDYIDNAYSLEGLDMTSNLMKDFGKMAAENMSDVDFWEEFVSGAIMGGVTPRPTHKTKKNGKTNWIPTGIEGGITDIWKTKSKYNSDQATIDELNKKIQDFDRTTLIKAANVIVNSMQRQKNAENLNDKKAFEDENIIQAATLIESLSEIGRADIVLNMIDEYEKYFSTEENRTKFATDDISKGGMSQKGSDGSELNEYSRLATDQERKQWIQDRLGSARQMIKDINTISYNIKRIMPSSVSAQDLIPIVIDRYRLYEQEGRLKDVIKDFSSNIIDYISNEDSDLLKEVKTFFKKNESAFDTRTLIEGNTKISAKAIAAQNLINLTSKVLTESQTFDTKLASNIIKDAENLLTYLNDYITLNNNVRKAAENPESISKAREKAEEKLSKKQQEKQYQSLLDQFNQGDDIVKSDLYNSYSADEKQYIDKHANKADVDFIKQKDKFFKLFNESVDRIQHSAINDAIKDESKQEVNDIIRNISRNDFKDLSNILSLIQSTRGTNIYNDYVIEQALSQVKANKAFESRFKNFMPVITSDDVNLHYIIDFPQGNDPGTGGTPAKKVGEESKQPVDNTRDTSEADLKEAQINPEVPVDRTQGSEKRFIYPAISKEDRDGKYEKDHRPFWEVDLTRKLRDHFEKQGIEDIDAKIKEYIDKLKSSKWSKITEESTNTDNIENGTYRGYYDIWTYLNEKGAFDYVDDGQLHKNDEVTFTIDHNLSDDDILIISKKNNQVLGVLPKSGIIGINELIAKIKSDLENGNETLSTKVDNIFNGIVQWSEDEHTLGLDHKDIKFAILNNGDFKGQGLEGLEIETWEKDINQYEGAVFALVKTARNTYFPVLLRSKSDFNNFEDENPINREINTWIEKLANPNDSNDVDEAYKMLNKYIYAKDLRITAHTTVTNSDNEESHPEVIDKPDGRNQGSPITHIGISNRSLDAEQRESYENDGKSKSNIVLIPLHTDDTISKLKESIASLSIRYNTISTLLNAGNYNLDILQSGILSCNALQLHKLSGSWFSLPYFDINTNTFATNTEIPTGVKGSKTQVKGNDSAVKINSYKIISNNEQPVNIQLVNKNNSLTYIINDQEFLPSDLDEQTVDLIKSISIASSIFNNPNKEYDKHYIKLNDNEYYCSNIIIKKSGDSLELIPADSKESLEVLDEYRKRFGIKTQAIKREETKVTSSNNIVENYTGNIDKDTTEDARKLLVNYDNSVTDKIIPIYYANSKGEVIKTLGIKFNDNIYLTFSEDDSNGFLRCINKYGSIKTPKIGKVTYLLNTDGVADTKCSLDDISKLLNKPYRGSTILAEITKILENQPRLPIDTQQSEIDQPVEVKSEVVNEETTQEGLDQALLDDINTLTRLADSNDSSEPISEYEQNWFTNALPRVSQEDRIILKDTLGYINNREVYGKFKDSIIYISNHAAKGTLYHEAFHLVSRSILDENYRQLIYNEAHKKWGEMSERDTEEKLADAFMNYMIDEEYASKGFGKFIRGFFKFLKNIVNIFYNNNRDELDKIDELFFKIKSGEFSSNTIRDTNELFYRSEYSGPYLDELFTISGLTNYNLLDQTFDPRMIEETLVPNLNRGLNKLSKIKKYNDIANLKNSIIIVGYDHSREYNTNITKVMTSNGYVFFDRNDIITQIYTSTFNPEILGLEQFEYDSLSPDKQKGVDETIGRELYDSMSLESRKNVIECL